MAKEIKTGDVRPLLQQVGFEVCKRANSEEDKQEWVQVEKITEAEILSYIYSLTPETKPEEKLETVTED